jgi:lipid-binding SYLF domain-containing protein
MKRMRVQLTALLAAAIIVSASAPVALALDREELARDGAAELNDLYAKNTAAKLLGQRARPVLVFPHIVKAGFMFGGQMGMIGTINAHSCQNLSTK